MIAAIGIQDARKWGDGPAESQKAAKTVMALTYPGTPAPFAAVSDWAHAF